MKFIRLLVFALFFAPIASFAAPNDFAMAAQLLAAAKNLDVQQVQVLVNNGANVNYVDNTGLSLVCTALMNNDYRAAQILQMYGADASACDRQIRNYRSRTVPERTGGVFGGLSTAQGMTLAAAGAAVVVGGLFLLTDVFKPDDDNYHGGGSSGGGSSGGGGGSSSSGTALFSSALPDGPKSLMPNYNYAEELGVWYLGDVWSQNFSFMNDNSFNYPNYLLMMHGYSPFARGYLGQKTLRSSTYVPLALDEDVTGGRPVNVALVTANGVNAAPGTSIRDNVYVNWLDATSATPNGTSNKYYNNNWTFDGGAYSETEDLSGGFDLSNSGTAIHNSLVVSVNIGDSDVLVTQSDDIVAAVVGGYTDGALGGDFVGFMPNGQMTIYRTGGGSAMVVLGTPVSVGSCVMAGDSLATGDSLTLTALDENFAVKVGDDVITGADSNMVLLTGTNASYYGYIGSDGLLYLDLNNDGTVDVAYELADGFVTQTKQLETSVYNNYAALLHAKNLRTNSVDGYGRSKTDVIANTDVIEPLHNRLSGTVNSVTSVGAENYGTKFYELITQYYDLETPTDTPMTQAQAFFEELNTASVYKKTNSMDGTSSAPLVVFSTGGSLQSSSSCQDELQWASFENAAPLVYPNLEHLFMSVVAVTSNTSEATTIAPNSDSLPTNTTQYRLSTWMEDGNYYKSRICGITGTGSETIDPWCFAGVGANDEMATAAVAGAAGVLTSAFHYMTPEQIFMLLALTADGPYLGRLTSSSQTSGKISESDLISHLQSLYQMPQGYESLVGVNTSYLDAFKQIFGYGVINLERATMPGTNLYYYTNGKIVSAPYNAYWRAAVNTGFHGSGALNIGRGAVNIVAYDIVESFDGTLSVPRIWENSFTFGTESARGLYMGNTLRDLATRAPSDNSVHIGNMSFSVSRGEYDYYDNLGGLDNMRFAYDKGNINLTAGFQRYLTDGESRFFGMSNPIMGLATNAMTVGGSYKVGNWSFGARGFSGAITDEGLLENDPSISEMFEPARLGNVSGAATSISWNGEKFGLTSSIGTAHESDTILGAYSTGMMGIGSADTNYVDFGVVMQPIDSVRLRAHATFAHTVPTAALGAMFNFSELDSNAFALGADFENFAVGVSMPLSVVRGALRYDYADYEIVDSENGGYKLNISDTGVHSIDVSNNTREVRLNASYRHAFGEFTDGAIGFIYRINPNNTRDFGDESIFMMKLSHRIGI